MATARDAVKASAPVAHITIELVDVYPIKVIVIAVKPDGTKVGTRNLSLLAPFSLPSHSPAAEWAQHGSPRIQ